jgi:hypothetical protein
MVFRRFCILGTAAPVTSDFKASLSLWKFPFCGLCDPLCVLCGKTCLFYRKERKGLRRKDRKAGTGRTPAPWRLSICRLPDRPFVPSWAVVCKLVKPKTTVKIHRFEVFTTRI